MEPINNLGQYQNCQQENENLNKELCNLRERINILNNERAKNENFYLTKIQSLSQEKNALEGILCKTKYKSGKEFSIEEVKNENEASLKVFEKVIEKIKITKNSKIILLFFCC